MLVWALNLLLACCTEFRCVTVLPIYIHLNSSEQCLHPYLCSFPGTSWYCTKIWHSKQDAWKCVTSRAQQFSKHCASVPTKHLDGNRSHSRIRSPCQTTWRKINTIRSPFHKEHYLCSSFSGGGKVEASPLSLEIVSADARFVPRMFRAASCDIWTNGGPSFGEPVTTVGWHEMSNGSCALAVLFLSWTLPTFWVSDSIGAYMLGRCRILNHDFLVTISLPLHILILKTHAKAIVLCSNK
jgi:hypothetical protein